MVLVIILSIINIFLTCFFFICLVKTRLKMIHNNEAFEERNNYLIQSFELQRDLLTEFLDTMHVFLSDLREEKDIDLKTLEEFEKSILQISSETGKMYLPHDFKKIL